MRGSLVVLGALAGLAAASVASLFLGGKVTDPGAVLGVLTGTPIRTWKPFSTPGSRER